MNREIKFRVFCKIHQRIEYYSLGDLVCGATTSRDGEGDFDGITWSQFTGLKDKNGKEIYEGDILAHSNFPKKGHEMFWNSKKAGFAMFHPIEEFEIIGNIYQNPELLK